jgi:hypothetical protein
MICCKQPSCFGYRSKRFRLGWLTQKNDSDLLMDKKWKSNTCTRTSSKSQDILKDSYDNSYLHSKDSHGDQT